jgi:hypothetical protein
MQTDKACTGHYCQGQRKPLTEFYVHKSGVRKGKPFSRCKRCWRWQVDHPQSQARERVPMREFRAVYDELVRRIGQTNTAHRIGVAVDTISRRRLAEKDSVLPETHERALAVLAEAQRNGEDGWDGTAVRALNLRPTEAGLARWRRHRERLQGVEYEIAMDLAAGAASWAKPDKDGNLRRFADFECKHGRLSGDKTPPCGCWNEGQV